MCESCIELGRAQARISWLESELDRYRREEILEQMKMPDPPQQVWAFFEADETGVYVTNPQTSQRVMLVPWAGKPFMRDGWDFTCGFPFVQDESCNRPAGHEGEHAHLNTAQLDSEKYAPPLFDRDPLRPRCHDGMHFYAAADAPSCYCGNTGMAANV